MTNLDNYRFERLSKDNIHHLIPLFKAVFHKNISVGSLLCKYDTSYLGNSFLGHIAFDKDRPVAFSGFISHKVQYNDMVEIGAQSVDSMSLNELRGKGLFKQIYFLNIELLKKEGIHFGYGFANQHSKPAFVDSLQWLTYNNMMATVIPVHKIPFAKIFYKIGLGSMNEQRIKRVLKGIEVADSFENPFKMKDTGYTVYDAAFLKYKSFNKHSIIYLNDVKVWLKITTELTVGNIEHCDKEKFFTVVDSICVLAKKLGMNRVVLQFSEHSTQAQMLKERFSAIQATTIIFKPLHNKIPLDKILFSNADIDTF